jgi:hypothetical protein
MVQKQVPAGEPVANASRLGTVVVPDVQGSIMPLRPYLDGRFFDPEVVQVMSIAFENMCRQLGLSGANDPLTKIVARNVIEACDNDCRDPALLTVKLMKQFGLPHGPEVRNGGAEERL